MACGRRPFRIPSRALDCKKRGDFRPKCRCRIPKFSLILSCESPRDPAPPSEGRKKDRPMNREDPCILTLNGGSSSIRFAVFRVGGKPSKSLSGKIDRIGAGGTTLSAEGNAGNLSVRRPLRARDHAGAVEALLDWIEGQPAVASIEAVGHRIVHGMRRSRPERVTARL